MTDEEIKQTNKYKQIKDYLYDQLLRSCTFTGTVNPKRDWRKNINDIYHNVKTGELWMLMYLTEKGAFWYRVKKIIDPTVLRLYKEMQVNLIKE